MAKRIIAGTRVILTGASSGIGRALAHALVDAGARVVGLAWSEAKLLTLAEELKSSAGQFLPLAGDVTQPEARAAALRLAQAEFGGLDLLINNAGIGARGRFDAAQADRLRRIMEVNFFAAAELIREALPMLRQGARPMIVNVGSILGHRGIPRMSEYCASKFALQGFSQSLRPELARTGIDVLVVSPGTTATDFFSHALEHEPSPWPEQRGVPAELVARRTLRAIERGRREILINPRGRLLVLLNRLAPGMVDRFLARYG